MLRQEMLLCVVAEETIEEVTAVTVYKTSRIRKHLKGSGP